jgi:hypothetical protein
MIRIYSENYRALTFENFFVGEPGGGWRGMQADNEHAPLRMNEHAPLRILAGSSGGLQGLQGMLRGATRSVLGFVAAVSFSAFSPSVVSAVMIMCICIDTYTDTHTHTHTHTHRHTHIVYIYMCVRECVYMCMSTYVYIHTYIHTYVYTYIHTYICI